MHNAMMRLRIFATRSVSLLSFTTLICLYIYIYTLLWVLVFMLCPNLSILLHVQSYYMPVEKSQPAWICTVQACAAL